MTLRDIDEVRAKLESYANPRALTFQVVVEQALSWAVDTMRDYPTNAEGKIRTRIKTLENLQGGPIRIITDAPREAQINALKWIIYEYDIDYFDPLY